MVNSVLSTCNKLNAKLTHYPISCSEPSLNKGLTK